MQRLTPQEQAIIDDLARRHGSSQEAVAHMLRAVRDGNGGMAQFSHPEFGGSGQWMRSGMLMLSDMFNHALRGRVDVLCHEMADILDTQPGLLHSGSLQSQSQRAGGHQSRMGGASSVPSSLYMSEPGDHWWPAELGAPNATGAQNGIRYAYFGAARRLAVNTAGEIQIYDTGDHRIGGFAQQQGPGGSITFSSQYGKVDLASLPVISRNGQPLTPAATGPGEPAMENASNEAASREADIFRAIERLGDLKTEGILTDEEFAAKKAELLGRL